MNIPQPKKELLVERIGEVNTIDIYFSSPQARNFIQENAPQFGSLNRHDQMIFRFVLYVNKTYDINEVITYLDSFNTKKDDTGEKESYED